MVEAAVALSMLSIGIVGIFTLLSNSYGFNAVSTNEYVAANLAAEGIEVARNILDKNTMRAEEWNFGLEDCTDIDGGCSLAYDSTEAGSLQDNLLQFHPDTGLYDYEADESTKFKRKMTITLNPDDDHEIQVISKVEWKDRGDIEYNVTLEDKLFNWR